MEAQKKKKIELSLVVARHLRPVFLSELALAKDNMAGQILQMMQKKKR